MCPSNRYANQSFSKWWQTTHGYIHFLSYSIRIFPMTCKVCARWRSFTGREIPRTTVPSPLAAILVNLCQHYVFASRQSDGSPLHGESARSLTIHLAEFLEVQSVGRREHDRMATPRTKHPLLYPLPNLLYPELDLIAILAWRPHARL